MYTIMNIEENIDDNECVICFEDISSNNFIYFDCCKKNFHKDCLDKWININKEKNNDLTKCIYCRQKSTIMDKLIKNNTQNNTQNNIIIEIPTIIITGNIFNNRRLRLKFLYTILIITLTILIILLVALFSTIDIIH